jgi:hypothetical protein
MKLQIILTDAEGTTTEEANGWGEAAWLITLRAQTNSRPLLCVTVQCFEALEGVFAGHEHEPAQIVPFRPRS